MNEFRKQQLRRVRSIQRQLKNNCGNLSDVLGSDRACALMRQAAEELGQVEAKMMTEGKA